MLACEGGSHSYVNYRVSDLDELVAGSYYFYTSLLFGADLGFHAEWLRDEP